MRVMNWVTCFAVLALGGVSVACGDKVGCDFRNIESGLNNGPEDRCQERSGLQSFGFDATCDGLGAESVPGGCDLDGVVFGCDLGQEAIDWYYPPNLLENAAQECGGDDAVIDAP